MKHQSRFPSDEFYTNACTYYNKEIQKFKSEIWTNLRKLGIRFIVLATYLVLGSLLFFYIEHCYHVVPAPAHRLLEKGFYQLCNKVNTSRTTQNSEQNENISSSGISLEQLMNTTSSSSLFEQEIRTICGDVLKQVPQYRCDLSFDNFMRWMEYVITVAFTIGYGYVVCHSSTGKIATIFYTLPAIAVTIRFYACAGEILAALTNILILKFELKCLKRTYIQYLRGKTVSLLVILSIMFWALIVVANIPLMGPAEGTLLDYIYMSFMTLTTIGFGDFSYSFHHSIEKPHVFISTFILYILAVGALASVFTELSQVGNKPELENDVKGMHEIKNMLKQRHHSNKKSTTKSRDSKKTIERLSPIGREQNKQNVIGREFDKQYAIGQGKNNEDYVIPFSFLNTNNDVRPADSDRRQCLEEIRRDMDMRCQRVTETELYIGCNKGSGVCY
ncbi:open rectifier potassium channel protein 1-like [Clytia hemisphaerica]|uniref:open rectifier potassium channel protein 1-like n=1 Tax=Clytia hemisphaerica TaxID=252671 RepID=UPI0034D6C078